VNFERDVVLSLTSLSTRTIERGTRDIIGRVDLQQLGERLDDPDSVAGKRQPSLIDDERLRRDEIAAYCAEPAGRNFDELRIGHVRQVGVVAHGRKIRASRRLLDVLVLLDLESSEPHDVVALQRHVHRLAQRNQSRRGRTCRLARCMWAHQ
jgi:hypothetical protein